VPTRVRQQVPNPGWYIDEWDSRVRCAWSDCGNPGSSLHYLIECFAAPHMRDHGELPQRMGCAECRKSLFCCAQHRDFQARSHLPGQYGKLPAGQNARYL
jgi:hypothetical protein